MVKSCSNCLKSQSEVSFAFDKRSKTGLSSWCRQCHVLSTKAWQKNNKTRIKEYSFQYARKDIGRFNSARTGAKARKISWDISFEEYCDLISDECFYCKGCFGNSKNAGSGLDRVDNNIGYTYDNLVPCCKICNKLKNDFLSIEETLVAVDAIIKLRTEKQYDINVTCTKGVQIG